MAASMTALRSGAVAGACKGTSKVSRRSTVQVRAIAEPQAQNLTPKQQSTIEYAKTLPGISEPFPNLFDPANFLTTASIKDVRRWREAEVTHGRVSMLAALGFIVQEQLEDFPAFINFDGHIQGPAIGHFQQVEARGAVFWEPLLFAIGLAESYRVSLGWETPRGSGFNALRDDYEPGNLGFDPLNLLPENEADRKIMQTKELNNGRLAMIAIAAFVAQELVSHDEIFEHLFVGVEKEVAAEEGTVARELAAAL